MQSLLEVSSLSVSYGGVRAVRDCSLRVEEGEAVAHRGPNGAGKSSTLRAIVGLVKSTGEVTFAQESIEGLACEKIVSRGLTMVPEGRRLFPQLTIHENLMLGARERRAAHEIYDDLLNRLPILAERRNQPAGTLSGGEQQQVAVARALMSRPRLLLIDEPSLGLAPTLVDRVYELLGELKAQGLSMLIVEQEVIRVLNFADRAYAMANGTIELSGTSEELKNSDDVKNFYLGTET
jgi:branched-chain amino acid transport system ATP-binding protein